MRQTRRLTTCAWLVAAAAGLPAQQSPQSPPPQFKSGVSLVTIDVSVIDKDGRPVKGLTADDFDVKLNGKPQPVRAAAFVEAARDLPASPVAASGEPARALLAVSGRTVRNVQAPMRPIAAPSAPVAAASGEPRVFVLLVDDLSFDPMRGKALFAAAKRFLDRLPPADLVGFTTTSTTGTINPTYDRASIAKALDRVVGQFSDPRFMRPSGPAAGPNGGNTGDADGGPSIDEALDIQGPNPAMLREVITRECYGGDVTRIASMTLETLITTSSCASDMLHESQRIAGLVRQNMARQLLSTQAIVTAMAGRGGIRHLVLLTDGVAIQKDPGLVTPLMRAAAQAGVQISVMVEDADASLSDAGRRDSGAGKTGLDMGKPQQVDVGRSQRRRDDAKMLMDGAHMVADMTGGIFYRVIGTPDTAFSSIESASAAVYRLGVEPPADTRPGRVFSVTVELRRRAGVVVRNNKQTVAAAPADPVSTAPPLRETPGVAQATKAESPSPDEELRAVVDTGKILADLPLAVAAMVRRSTHAQDQVDVTINVEIPAEVEGPLTTLLGIVDEGGGVRNSGLERLESGGIGRPYAKTLLIPLAPGTYRLRFAAADRAGHVGSVEARLNARVTTMGPLTTSDVLTWYADPAGKAQLFALEDVPDAAGTLHASLELYGPSGDPSPAGAVVKWTLTPSDRTGPPVVQEGPPAVGPGLMRADAVFEAKDLAVGLYTLRAALVIDGAEAGAASTTLRKR